VIQEIKLKDLAPLIVAWEPEEEKDNFLDTHFDLKICREIDSNLI
jgi:hypothetical protein